MNTKTITLTHGLTVGKSKYKTLKLRTPTLGDLMEAEQYAHPTQSPISYRVGLAAAVLTAADDFPGPFTPGMLKILSPVDWVLVSDALNEVQASGESELSDGAGS